MARAAPPPPPPPTEPINVNLRDALEERYLAYALSTIMGRALPDARDGQRLLADIRAPERTVRPQLVYETWG